MNQEKSVMTFRRYLHLLGLLLVLAVTFGQWLPTPAAQRGSPAPEFKVDPFWPRPLPSIKDETGQSHQWVTGEPGATCIDSQDHVITVNRGFLRGGLLGQEGASSIPSPPVIEFDADGRIVHGWGDATLTPEGTTAVLPNGVHGCFVDHENNVWLAGNADGVVQKWTHDSRGNLYVSETIGGRRSQKIPEGAWLAVLSCVQRGVTKRLEPAAELGAPFCSYSRGEATT
jgi:hypothetical protein